MRNTHRTPRRPPVTAATRAAEAEGGDIIWLAALLLALLGSLVLASQAEAATFDYRSPEALAAAATAVVEGRVTAVSGRRASDGGIVTETQVSVERTWMGEAPATVTVRTAGGQLGGEREMVPGVPTFSGGERVLLFLTAADDGTYEILGLAQGALRIRTGQGGEPEGVPTADPRTRYLMADGQFAPAARPLALVALGERVAAVASRQPVVMAGIVP